MDHVKRECISSNIAGVTFCEPSGIDFLPKNNFLLICDTNNHRVLKANLEENTASELHIQELNVSHRLPIQDNDIFLGKFEIDPGKDLLLTFDFLLSNSVSLTKDSTHCLKVIVSPFIWTRSGESSEKIEFSDLKSLTPITLVPRNPDQEGSTRICIECTFFLCNGLNGSCFRRNLKFVIPLKITKSLKLWNENQVIRVTHEIS